jgi:ubiquitin carboxyl-terminal hydrolase L5
MSWDTVESGPEVLTEMLESLGVKGVEVEELWALDKELVEPLKPYALFFLFKWKKSLYKSTGAAAIPPEDQALIDSCYFARQTVSNACCTLALLHSLFNTEKKLELGPTLEEFRAFSADLPSDIRGDLLVCSDAIRTTHNSFARPEPFEIEEDKRDRRKGEAFHFIAYVPRDGRVVELDGLKQQPVVVGRYGGATGETWLDVATRELQRRMQEYQQAAMSAGAGSAAGDDEEEIRFNLLALVKDKRKVICQKLRTALTRLEAVSAIASSLSEDGSAVDTSKAETLSAEITAEIPEFSSSSSESSDGEGDDEADEFNPPADDLPALLRMQDELVGKIQGLRAEYQA